VIVGATAVPHSRRFSAKLCTPRFWTATDRRIDRPRAITALSLAAGRYSVLDFELEYLIELDTSWILHVLACDALAQFVTTEAECNVIAGAVPLEK
jgi:hypothetical protein